MSMLRVALVALLSVALLPAEASAKKKRAAPRGKAAKVQAPVRPQLDEALGPRVFETLEKGTRSGDMRARGAAFHGLGLLQWADSDPLAYLLDGLKDPQAVVRLGAIRGLVHLQNAAYRDPLVQVLTERATDIQGVGIEVLSELPASEAFAVVADALAVERNTRADDLVRGLLREGGPLLLGSVEEAMRRGGPAAIAFKKTVPTLDWQTASSIYPRLLGVADDELKIAIISNTERFPEGADLDFLKPLMRDKAQPVAFAAARALALRGDADAATVLLPAAKSEDQKTRLMALEAIQQAATKKHLPELQPLLDPASRMPANVIGLTWMAFARAGDQSIGPQLRAALTGTDGLLRQAAVRALGLVEGGRALGTLQQSVVDGNPNVREAAALALGDINTTEAIDPLEQALNDPVEEVRLAAVRSLSRIRDPRVVQTMQFLVSDPNTDVKLVTIRALGALKSLDAVSTLSIAMQDADPVVREAALRAVMDTDLVQGRAAFKTALGWLPRGALLDMARTMGKDFGAYVGMSLEHADPAVRTEGLLAMRLLGRDVETSLLEGVAARSLFPDLRLDALARLRQLGQTDIAPLLQSVLVDPDASVDHKVRAVRILGDARAQSARSALEILLIDPNDTLRVQSAIALVKLAMG